MLALLYLKRVSPKVVVAMDEKMVTLRQRIAFAAAFPVFVVRKKCSSLGVALEGEVVGHLGSVHLLAPILQANCVLVNINCSHLSRISSQRTIIKSHGGYWIKIREPARLLQNPCRRWPEYLLNPFQMSKSCTKRVSTCSRH